VDFNAVQRNHSRAGDPEQTVGIAGDVASVIGVD
jgi:hypothetical protein